jgi:hypothetical protein
VLVGVAGLIEWPVAARDSKDELKRMIQKTGPEVVHLGAGSFPVGWVIESLDAETVEEVAEY